MCVRIRPGNGIERDAPILEGDFENRGIPPATDLDVSRRIRLGVVDDVDQRLLRSQLDLPDDLGGETSLPGVRGDEIDEFLQMFHPGGTYQAIFGTHVGAPV